MPLEDRPQLGGIGLLQSCLFGEGSRINPTTYQLPIDACDKATMRSDDEAGLESDRRFHARALVGRQITKTEQIFCHCVVASARGRNQRE